MCDNRNIGLNTLLSQTNFTVVFLTLPICVLGSRVSQFSIFTSGREKITRSMVLCHDNYDFQRIFTTNTGDRVQHKITDFSDSTMNNRVRFKVQMCKSVSSQINKGYLKKRINP